MSIQKYNPSTEYTLSSYHIEQKCSLFSNRINIEKEGKKINQIRSYSAFIGNVLLAVSKIFRLKKIIKIEENSKIYYVNTSSFTKKVKKSDCKIEINNKTIEIVNQTLKTKKTNRTQTAANSEVLLNRDVFEKKCSDHAIITFNTPDGPIITSNVMCSGEDHDPKKANSFGIDPFERDGREQRFKDMVENLAIAAKPLDKPIIALQEFPRRNKTGTVEFANMLRKEFSDHQLIFGNPERSDHDQSQLCLLVPKEYNVEVFEQPNPRILAVRINNIAYINIHPSPSGEEDVLQNELKDLAEDMIKKGCDNVHIVGDWNRKQEQLEAFWEYIDSPNEKSHYPPCDHMEKFKQNGMTGWPRPIDHHVMVKGS